MLFLHAAHLHTQMLCFDYHADATGIGRIHDRFRNLLRQSLLNLQPACIHIDDASDFGQAQHLARRQITDVTIPEKRQYVMFAQRVKLDVLDDHDFVQVRIEQRIVDYGIDVLLVSSREELNGICGALWRPNQAIASFILADGPQN